MRKRRTDVMVNGNEIKRGIRIMSHVSNQCYRVVMNRSVNIQGQVESGSVHKLRAGLVSAR